MTGRWNSATSKTAPHKIYRSSTSDISSIQTQQTTVLERLMHILYGSWHRSTSNDNVRQHSFPFLCLLTLNPKGRSVLLWLKTKSLYICRRFLRVGRTPLLHRVMTLHNSTTTCRKVGLNIYMLWKCPAQNSLWLISVCSKLHHLDRWTTLSVKSISHLVISLMEQWDLTSFTVCSFHLSKKYTLKNDLLNLAERKIVLNISKWASELLWTSTLGHLVSGQK